MIVLRILSKSPHSCVKITYLEMLSSSEISQIEGKGGRGGTLGILPSAPTHKCGSEDKANRGQVTLQQLHENMFS